MAQQTLSQVRSGIDILRVTLEAQPGNKLRLYRVCLAGINVAQLRMMMRLIEMMNLRLQLFDTSTVVSAGQTRIRAWPKEQRGKP